jgi:hypothetical protein
MKKTIKAAALVSACVVQLCILGGVANATPTVTASIGGAAAGSTLDNLDSLNLGTAPQTSSTGILVSFSPDAGVVSGSSSGIYAPPYLSGGNGTGFGSGGSNQADGLDLTTFITAGGTATSSATLAFNEDLHYFGLLWGSIDTFNSLELLEGNTVVGTVTGTQAATAAHTLPSGDQALDGTAYVNITSDVAFDAVEFLSPTQHAFEFDNVSYSPNAIPTVPEPLTLSLFGAGLAGAAAIRRRKKAKQA